MVIRLPWQGPRAAAAPPQGGAPGGSGRLEAPMGGVAGPQAALPRPLVLEPAASKAADITAFDRPGLSSAGAAPGVHVPALGAGLACGAAHLAWQLRTVDFHSRADCLRKFQPSSMSRKCRLSGATARYLGRPGCEASGQGCPSPTRGVPQPPRHVAACGADVSLYVPKPPMFAPLDTQVQPPLRRHHLRGARGGPPPCRGACAWRQEC